MQLFPLAEHVSAATIAIGCRGLTLAHPHAESSPRCSDRTQKWSAISQVGVSVDGDFIARSRHGVFQHAGLVWSFGHSLRLHWLRCGLYSQHISSCVTDPVRSRFNVIMGTFPTRCRPGWYFVLTRISCLRGTKSFRNLPGFDIGQSITWTSLFPSPDSSPFWSVYSWHVSPLVIYLHYESSERQLQTPECASSASTSR